MDSLLKLGRPMAATREAPLERMPLTMHDQVAAFYEEYREQLFRYLLVLGLSQEESQDLCQEVFLRLYAELRRGVRIENVRAWLYAVARNAALAKSPADAACLALDARAEECLADGAPTLERELLEREKYARLRRAVLSLSRQQRHCLHLRVEGFRYREIAGIIGVSTSTVGEFLRRAVSRLRKEMYE